MKLLPLLIPLFLQNVVADSVSEENRSASVSDAGSAQVDRSASLDLPSQEAQNESVPAEDDIMDHFSDDVQIFINSDADAALCERAVLKGRMDLGYDLLTSQFFHLHTHELFQNFPDDPEYADQFMDHLQDENLLDLITPFDVFFASDVLMVEFGRRFKFMAHLMGTIHDGHFRILANYIIQEDVQLVPMDFVKRLPVCFVEELNMISCYSVEQIKVVTNIVACCRRIDPFHLSWIGSREKWEAINPICFAHMDLANTDLSHLLRRDIIPGNMFSYYSGYFHAKTSKAMTAKHLRYYGTEAEKGLAPLDLNLIPPSAAAGVTPDKFFTYIMSLNGPQMYANLKEKWKYFPENIFSSFSRSKQIRQLAARLSKDNYPEMSRAQIAFILKDPEGCAGIRLDADISKDQIEEMELSSKCFAAMHPNLQMKIISSGAALPDNILEYIGSQELLRLDFSIYSLNKLKGKNVAKIIENLSSKIEEKQLHACRLIKEPEVLRNLRIFKKAMPKNCWKFMTMKIKAKNVLKNPTLFAGRPKVLKTLLENEKGYLQNLNLVGRRGVQKLTAGRAGRECRFMNLDTFDIMSGELRSGLSPTCIASLPFLNVLDSEDVIHVVPNGFSHIDNKLAKELNLAILTNRQLEHLSEAVNFTRTAGSALTRSVLENQIKANRLSHLPARVWGTVPAPSFAIFNDPGILARIPGEKMAYWTKEQVSVIPRDVLASLDREQAAVIGSLSGEKRALIKYLVGIIPRKNMPAKVVLGERISGESNSASSSIRAVACSLALTGLMTIAMLL